MPQRLRKFLGVFVTVAFMIVYALAAMTLAVRVLPETGAVAQAIYYFVAGVLWVIPVGLVVRWMERPDA